jgi:hypothetical protein
MDQTFNEFEDFETLQSQVQKLKDFIAKLSATCNGIGVTENEKEQAYQARKRNERLLAEKLLKLEEIKPTIPKTAMDYLIEHQFVVPKIASIEGVKYAVKQTIPIWLSILYYSSIVIMMIILPAVIIYLNYYQIYLF